jgi:hypothetical protein
MRELSLFKEIFKCLSKNTRFSFEDLFICYRDFKSLDILLKGISYADKYNVSLYEACNRNITVKSSQEEIKCLASLAKCFVLDARGSFETLDGEELLNKAKEILGE